MPHGAAILFQRTLLLDQRRALASWIRVGLLALTFLAVFVHSLESQRSAAPGLQLLRTFFDMGLTGVIGFGLGYFPSIISEETEDGILELLVISGLRPSDILSGKALARVGQALLIVAVQAPFLFLSVTLGGVLPGHVTQALLFLTCFVLFMASTGLLVSVGAGDVAAATRRFLPVVLFLVLGGTVFRGLAALLPALSAVLRPLAEILSGANPYLILGEHLTPGSAPQEVARYSLLYALAASALSALTWLHLRHRLRNPASAAAPRSASRRSRRVCGHPVVWQTLRFQLGGRRLRHLNDLAALLLLLAAFSSGEAQGYLIVFFLILLTLGGAAAVHLLGPEARSGTLDNLVLLPHSATWLLSGKLVSLFRVLLPWLLAVGLVLLSELLIRGVNYPVGAAFVATLLLVEFLVYLQFCVIFSFHMRWGAIPMAFFLTFGGMNIGLGLIGFPTMGLAVWFGAFWTLSLVLAVLLIQWKQIRDTLLRGSLEPSPL